MEIQVQDFFPLHAKITKISMKINFTHMEVRKTVKTVLLTESEVKITLFLDIKFMLRHFYIPN